MSNQNDADIDAHLADLEDGAGCTEIWEKLSEGRSEVADETGDEQAVKSPTQ
ncbi:MULTISPECIES: hypothetical protein [Haloferax]|uniref:hypothetical protein n=1 Tax=Haloferax TaxID=2251 RepID=UPI001782DDC6|nr:MULTISPECIES: hypothetical protein [Haloferax]